jgi:hypothetical protein
MTKERQARPRRKRLPKSTSGELAAAVQPATSRDETYDRSTF